MINVTVVRTPSLPAGVWPPNVYSANMFEVRVNDEPVQAFVNEGDAENLKDNLAVVLSKVRKPLEQIASLWPDPGMCAEIAPAWVGPNDGRMRADMLWYALNTAREALGLPTYPRPEHWDAKVSA